MWNTITKTPNTLSNPVGNGLVFILLAVEIDFLVLEINWWCSFCSVHSVALPNSNCCDQTFGTMVYKANAYSLTAGRFNEHESGVKRMNTHRKSVAQSTKYILSTKMDPKWKNCIYEQHILHNNNEMEICIPHRKSFSVLKVKNFYNFVCVCVVYK